MRKNEESLALKSSLGKNGISLRYERERRKMSPTTSLTDLTDDALLLILQKLILDNVGLRSLRRCCKFFRNFFSAYQTELRAMREKALEHAWMDPSPMTTSSIKVADNLSEKEEVLMRGEEAHSGGVIFLAACNRFCKTIAPHH